MLELSILNVHIIFENNKRTAWPNPICMYAIVLNIRMYLFFFALGVGEGGGVGGEGEYGARCRSSTRHRERRENVGVFTKAQATCISYLDLCNFVQEGAIYKCVHHFAISCRNTRTR